MTAPVRLHGKGHADPGKKCHHLHEHRLSCADYEDYRDRAGGHCEMCGISEERVYRQLLQIDHCHESGRVRGLLCGKCNIVMACADGRKPWGANRIWEAEAERYVELSLLWDAYRRVCARRGSDWATEIRRHVESVLAPTA